MSIELTEQLTKHYARLLEEINTQYEAFLNACGKDYIEHQRRGLKHWVDAGKKRYLNWGILHFRKCLDENAQLKNPFIS